MTAADASFDAINPHMSDAMPSSERYAQSTAFLKKAESLIPLGSQTFSKSKVQFPVGQAPLFIERSEGAYCWDLDGNKYVDCINGLASVLLGHAHPQVSRAVHEQIDRGVIFSLPSTAEYEVASRIVDLVPSAEKVRFGKNGSDATSAAIRLARAYTGRDLVAVCGYHGWHDWYIGSTSRHLGVPEAVRNQTMTFRYNDIDSLASLLAENSGKFAAIIMEPMNIQFPRDGFLAKVRDLATQHGAVLVFDEIVTGFRFHRGGAQSMFNVVPDLTALGKGLANGYALSAICGRGDIMDLMESIFFSGTMGGELASLAAARVSLDIIRDEDVPAVIAQRGQRLLDETANLIDRHGLADVLSIAGHPSWSILVFSDGRSGSGYEMKTLYMQEALERGILTLGTHNMSQAMTDDDVSHILAVYEEVFATMGVARQSGAIRSFLRCDPLQPLFKVR